MEHSFLDTRIQLDKNDYNHNHCNFQHDCDLVYIGACLQLLSRWFAHSTQQLEKNDCSENSTSKFVAFGKSDSSLTLYMELLRSTSLAFIRFCNKMIQNKDITVNFVFFELTENYNSETCNNITSFSMAKVLIVPLTSQFQYNKLLGKKVL